MTPLKETLEVTSAAETASPAVAERPKQQQQPGGLRSDAVSLEVPVKVHGSRVTEVVRGVTPHTEPFEEETGTMIVFPQGGVLRMSTPVTAGQMMVLTNLKSGHDAICRVVKVRAYAQSQSYVEVEFTNRQQGYWGVKFSGDTDEPAKMILPPAPVISSTVGMESENAAPQAPAAPPAPAAKQPEPAVSWAPAKAMMPPPVPVSEPRKKPSSFVSIGTQEDVQPAAAPTLPKPIWAERPVTPTPSLSMSDLLGDAAPAPPSRLAIGAGVPGEVTELEQESHDAPQPSASPATAGSEAEAPAQGASQVFGARFGSLSSAATDAASDAPAGSSTNWFLIVTGIAALLIVAVGGGLYFHVFPGSKAAPRAESPSISQSAASAAMPANPVAASVAAPTASLNAQSAPAPAVASPNVSVTVSEPAPVAVNASRTATERTPANQRPAKPAPQTFSTSAAHPVSSQRAVSGDAEAPSVDGGSAANGELQGLSFAADVAPPPAPALPRIKVGGDVQQPKLISSVMPIYPPTAKAAGITGNVVIQASISTTGAVTATKVLSGPAMLRQAAVDAVKHWKYQPGMLNGDPVAVDITVTMAFHN